MHDKKDSTIFFFKKSIGIALGKKPSATSSPHLLIKGGHVSQKALWVCLDSAFVNGHVNLYSWVSLPVGSMGLAAEVVYNNLGGQGPGHLDDPLELRFADTASMRHPDGSHGQRVDVAWGTQEASTKKQLKLLMLENSC